MENAPNIEMGERPKYQPKYMIFLGRHAEPAKKSIFDQVGGEQGIRSDNFEESSLTLRGVTDASLLNYDLLKIITDRMPEGRIKIVFANTEAYRTRETADIIRERLEKEAQKLDREIEVEFEGPEQEDLLTESREETAEQSAADISALIESLRQKSLGDENLVLFGITHETKIRDYLDSVGVPVDEIRTTEFLSITDLGEGKNRVSFRDQSIETQPETE